MSATDSVMDQKALGAAWDDQMRVMDIYRFYDGPNGSYENIGDLIKKRLVENIALFPHQSSRLISYIAWPNDETARDGWMRVHVNSAAAARESNDRTGNQPRETTSKVDPHWAAAWETPEVFLRRLKLIQQHWARAADILHLHYDLAQGGHQKRRGGPSVGKAIHLLAATAKVKGTAKSKLWEIWRRYKDVAHLTAAAVLVSAEAQHRHRAERWEVPTNRLRPLHVIDLLPDLVLGVAMTFEKYGLEAPVHGREGPLFDPATLWRIPDEIGLSAVPPPARRIRAEDTAVLNARRAGHRGKRRPSKATPVLK
jgi:hypothetical protein